MDEAAPFQCVDALDGLRLVDRLNPQLVAEEVAVRARRVGLEPRRRYGISVVELRLPQRERDPFRRRHHTVVRRQRAAPALAPCIDRPSEMGGQVLDRAYGRGVLAAHEAAVVLSVGQRFAQRVADKPARRVPPHARRCIDLVVFERVTLDGLGHAAKEVRGQVLSAASRVGAGVRDDQPLARPLHAEPERQRLDVRLRPQGQRSGAHPIDRLPLMLQHQRIRPRRWRPCPLGRSQHVHRAESQVAERRGVDHGDAALAELPHGLTQHARRIARLQVVADSAAEYVEGHAPRDDVERAQILQRLDDRLGASRVGLRQAAQPRQVLVPGAFLRTRRQGAVEVRHELTEHVDPVGDAGLPLEPLHLRRLALLAGQPREALVPLRRIVDDAGLAGVRLPLGRPDASVPGGRLACEPRLGQELHHLRASERRIRRQLEQRQQPAAERVRRQQPAVVQVRLDPRFGEDLVDQRAIRLAVAIDDGHLMKADAVFGPAEAAARGLPHFTYGVRGAGEGDGVLHVEFYRGPGEERARHAHGRRRVVDALKPSLRRSGGQQSGAERGVGFVDRARSRREEHGDRRHLDDAFDQPRLQLSRRPDSVHQQGPFERREVDRAIVIGRGGERASTLGVPGEELRQIAQLSWIDEPRGRGRLHRAGEAHGREPAELQLAKETRERLGEAVTPGDAGEVAARLAGDLAGQQAFGVLCEARHVVVANGKPLGELVRPEEVRVDERDAAQGQRAAQVRPQQHVVDEHGHRTERIAAASR